MATKKKKTTTRKSADTSAPKKAQEKPAQASIIGSVGPVALAKAQKK